jgi:hypothetical protein
MAANESTSSSFVGRVTQLFALYVVYVFVSGWTFFDYYYRKFQIDPRWLDLPIQEVLVKGFTVLFTGGYWLWPLYLLIIVGALAIDEMPSVQSRLWVRLVTGPILFVALVCIYFASRNAGISEAQIDEGPGTRLPLITFSKKQLSSTAGTSSADFTGHVLALRNGTFYLHNVSELGNQSSASIGLWVVRSEELTDVQIVER